MQNVGIIWGRTCGFMCPTKSHVSVMLFFKDFFHVSVGADCIFDHVDCLIQECRVPLVELSAETLRILSLDFL